jgi:hypothetical protein
MARPIPIEYVVEVGEIIPLTLLDEVDNIVNTTPMTCGSPHSSGQFTQMKVDQIPKFENSLRKRKGRRPNQVVGKSGIIRRDKREKVKYL